jgi:hypothetical protein
LRTGDVTGGAFGILSTSDIRSKSIHMFLLSILDQFHQLKEESKNKVSALAVVPFSIKKSAETSGLNNFSICG